jgi:hypothetical protein
MKNVLFLALAALAACTSNTPTDADGSSGSAETTLVESPVLTDDSGEGSVDAESTGTPEEGTGEGSAPAEGTSEPDADADVEVDGSSDGSGV